MTLKQTLGELKKVGTAQNRKIYGRHGVCAPMYGVSYANLTRLTKAIKRDHELACSLWATGNHDARILACMVADPGALGSREADQWVRELDNYVLADAFSGLMAQSPLARRKSDIWMKRKNEWVSTAGWNILCHLAGSDESLTDAACEEWIAVIARDIHTRPNRTRHSMNQALICLGIRNKRLQKKAEVAAGKIGRVVVDHGETSCKTPDAVATMAKVGAHRNRKSGQ